MQGTAAVQFPPVITQYHSYHVKNSQKATLNSLLIKFFSETL